MAIEFLITSLAMNLALAKRFKLLVVLLPIVAALKVVLVLTGKHGWIAFSAFIATLWLVLKISADYGFRFPPQRTPRTRKIG